MLRLSASMLVLGLSVLSGCGENKPQMTVAKGLTQLQTHRDTIKAAFDAGTPKECDSALHDAFDLVTNLPAIAEAEGLSADAVATVKKASTELMEQFNKIHEGFHDHGEPTETPSFDSVAEGIDTALASLSSLSGN